ncbi:unnamed protein product [marine sediment metagenome]|uniref:Uncharacterized protein n=1 Tax=marine sediment metagenome TaxID=412755 RepID=X1IWX9_9ZZZZ
MEIRNSTTKTLVIYTGDKNEEEPEMVKTLLVGETFEIDANAVGILSIQEQ